MPSVVTTVCHNGATTTYMLAAKWRSLHLFDALETSVIFNVIYFLFLLALTISGLVTVHSWQWRPLSNSPLSSSCTFNHNTWFQSLSLQLGHTAICLHSNMRHISQQQSSSACAGGHALYVKGSFHWPEQVLWTVGGNQSACTKPTHTCEEHANFTEERPRPKEDLEMAPFWCEVKALCTKTLCYDN